MTRQNLNTGIAANDGTGDTLRQAGIKINQNFTELYTYLGNNGSILPIVSTITANGTLSLSSRYFILNKSTALALTLPNGAYTGQQVIFTNKGAGLATITANLAGTSVSFALAINEGCQVIWDGTEWYLIGNQSVVTLA